MSRAESGAPPYWQNFESLVGELAVDVSRCPLSGPTPVHLYQSGHRDAPDLIVVSPPESPFLLISRMYRELSGHFRVHAWDHPAAAYMDCPAALPPPTLREMSGDLLALVERCGAKPPHVASWCSGALIVLWALARNPLAFSSVSFVAPPSVLGMERERTDFQSRYLQLILELASGSNRDEAALIQRLRSMMPDGRALTGTDRLVYELSRLPVRDDVALRRYAESMRNCCLLVPPEKAELREHAYVELVSQACACIPIALLHCRDDAVVSFKCSYDVVVRNENVRLLVYPRGGHFVIMTEPAMLTADIASFVHSVGP